MEDQKSVNGYPNSNVLMCTFPSGENLPYKCKKPIQLNDEHRKKLILRDHTEKTNRLNLKELLQ